MDDWDHRIRLRELFTGALPGHWGKGLSSSSDETTPGYCVQFWASQHSKDVAKWAGSAEGPYAGRGQHHLHCEHRLREWGLFKPGENVSTRRPKGSLLTHTRGFWRTQSWAIYGGAHWDSEMQQTLKKKYEIQTGYMEKHFHLETDCSSSGTERPRSLHSPSLKIFKSS